MNDWDKLPISVTRDAVYGTIDPDVIRSIEAGTLDDDQFRASLIARARAKQAGVAPGTYPPVSPKLFSPAPAAQASAAGVDRARSSVRATEAVGDGTAVLAHDAYDVNRWTDARSAEARLVGDETRAGQVLDAAGPDLVRDLWWSFYQAAPVVAPPAPLRPSHAMNEQLLGEALSTRDWAAARDAGTPGDPLYSSIAATAALPSVLAGVPAPVRAAVQAAALVEQRLADLLAQIEQTTTRLEVTTERRPGSPTIPKLQAALAAQHARLPGAQAALAAQAAAMQAVLTDPVAAALRQAARAGAAAAQAAVEDVDSALGLIGGGEAGHEAGSGAGALPADVKRALAAKIVANRKLLEIARLAGRLRFAAAARQARKVSRTSGQITGVVPGRDVRRTLPADLALLARPGSRGLFLARYHRGDVLTWETHDRQPEGRGPIALIIDTSGSMQGASEVAAKGIGLALLEIARAEGRDFSVIHFAAGSQVRAWDWPRGVAAPEAILAWLGHFFNGGTAYEPWMAEALRRADSAAHDKADVILLTDGLATVGAATLAHWQATRTARGMRVQTICIGADRALAADGLLAQISDTVTAAPDLLHDHVLDAAFSI